MAAARPTRCEEIVDQHDALPWFQGITVKLERVLAVFERVHLPYGFSRQLAELACRHERHVPVHGERHAEDETA